MYPKAYNQPKHVQHVHLVKIIVKHVHIQHIIQYEHQSPNTHCEIQYIST